MGNKKEYNQYLWAPEQPRVYETSPLRISGTPMSEEDAAMSLRAENLQQSLQQNPIFKSAKQRVAQQKQREKEIAASKKWLELHPDDDNDDPYIIFERGKHQAIVNGKDPSYYEKMINDGKQFTKGALTALSLPYLGAAAAGAYGYGASLGARGLFAGQGIYGLANENGVRKTANLIKSGNYGRAALSGAGDALNAAMIFPGAKFLGSAAKYGLKSTVAGDILGQNVRNATLVTSKPLLNVGWGPKKTLKVSRAGEYDQMYFPERWDVVNEGANPHGVWLQGKYGTPRTDLTNPGKGAKAARARNVFSTRSDKYTGTVTLDKPIVTIGEVPNRSSLSYQVDNMGADGLVYNGVYDNGYNNNQVILSFRKPELTKIQLSEAELKGVPKSVRNFVPSDNEPFRKQLIDTYNGWIKQFNQPIADQNKWAQEYADYWNSVGVKTSPPFASEIPYESIPDNATIPEAKRIIENTMRRHNQFYRGVTKPVLNEDISLVKGLSDEEALIQATQPRPGDGVWITPASNAFIYGSNGKTALLRRPYKLGKNPMNWIKEGDFKIRGYRPEESTAYGIPKPNTVYDPWHSPDNPAQGHLTELWSTQPLKFIKWREYPNAEETSLNWMTYKQGGILKRVESGKSGIYIKPENRGKLTRLKKRTSKSEAELWKEGNPAVRKMITFARNSRKWKHK